MDRPFSTLPVTLRSRPGESRRLLWLWAPVGLYMGALFVSSSLSTLPSPPARVTDKHVHAAAYAGLSALAVRAAAGATWQGLTRRAVWRGIAVASGYGVFDEVHQRFVPGRDASLLDLAADVAGALAAGVGAGAWGIIRDRQRARR